MSDLEFDTDWLSSDEKASLEYLHKHRDSNPRLYFEIPFDHPSVPQMLDLYLKGYNLFEIRSRFQRFSEGQIIELAVKQAWYKKKEEFTSRLQERTIHRVSVAQHEAVEFIVECMEALAKHNRKEVIDYLNGESDVPESIKKANLKQYKELVEMLMKLTGQDRNKSITIMDQTKPKEVVELPKGKFLPNGEVELDAEQSNSILDLVIKRKSK